MAGSLTRKHGVAQSLAGRARIGLAAATGPTNKEIAAGLVLSAHTVGTWRKRFAQARTDGLDDEPVPGSPRRIGDDEIAAMIRKTRETRLKGSTHRSLRGMEQATGQAPSTIHRIRRACGLQPHRSETIELSSDPPLVEKVRAIVGLWQSPPDRAEGLLDARR